MSDSSGSQPSGAPAVSTWIDQVAKGDRNQVIGQVLGGMVVHVSGGQRRSRL